MELTEQNQKRMEQIVREHAEKGHRMPIARILGANTANDMADYIPGYDDGEEPHGATSE